MTKIAINGFGRIGRAAFRILYERNKANENVPEVVAVNDLTDAETLAHLLRYDSVHGRFNGAVEVSGNEMRVDGNPVRILAEKEPSSLPWKEMGVDIVLESTGRFLSRDLAAKHLVGGAKKVLISAPAKGTPPDATICYGVNNDIFRETMEVVSTASCTTNCMAPVAQLLDQHYGFRNGLMTTVHSYTNDQRILDLPHKDLRRARAAQMSMIPTTTGAARALDVVLPELAGKIDGMAIRVPTPCVSLVDMVVNLEKEVSVQELNEMFKKASENQLNGVLGYCDEPLVSTDYIGTRCSSIIDALSTKVIDGKTAKILVWYDNEWGFTNRAVDLLGMLAKAC